MDKRRKSYVLPYATKYSVNSDGDIWKIKTGKEMRINEYGVIQITTDEGKRVWIHPLNEFNSLHYHTVIRNSVIDLGPEFLGYYMRVENHKPVIYPKHTPGKPLTPDSESYVRLLNYEGIRKTMSIYKLLAIYKLGQMDTGPVHVEQLFNNFGYKNNVMHSSEVLSNMNVQIIHYSLRYKNVQLLQYHPGYCLVDNRDPNLIEVYHCRTGVMIDSMFDHEGIKRFKLPITKQYVEDIIINVEGEDGDVTTTIEERVSYEGGVFVGLDVEELKLNPRIPKYNNDMQHWRRI